jgi:hypothetical protein
VLIRVRMRGSRAWEAAVGDGKEAGAGLVGTGGTDGRGDVAPETDGAATVFAPATRALTRAWLDGLGANAGIMFFDRINYVAVN